MSGEIIPISDEQAKLGQKALEVLQGFGGFLREMLGTVPEDIVGVLGGDWLKVRRAVNMASMLEKAREKLERRGVKQKEEVSLNIALPLLRAAADESREELRELWARLLANSMDPARAHVMRQEFIGALKAFEPLDARVLEALHETTMLEVPDYRQHVANQLGISSDEFAVSVENLAKLGCLHPDATRPKPIVVAAFGRELLRAVAP